jgi:hypothetical protein
MQISLKYSKAIVIHDSLSNYNNDVLSMSINAEMMKLGFIMSEKLFNMTNVLSENELIHLYDTLIQKLRVMKGDHVTHKPMYNNFPQEVMEKSEFELYLNAVIHYWSKGSWMPESPIIKQNYTFENTKFIEIGVSDTDEFNNIFTSLVTSNESLSESDRKVVEWFLDNIYDLPIPQEIPFKENMCVVAGYMLNRDEDISTFVKTATDVLRIATYLSDGDVSLASNTKFKSFPRPIRRKLVKLLESTISEEDINRHRNKWIKLFHSLHVGDYSKKVFDIAQKFRDNKNVETFNTKVEAAIKGKHITEAVELLITRPGEFARRIDHLLRLTDRKKGYVIESFLNEADRVDTRVLLQLLGNLKIRKEDNTHKIIFPKGNVQRAIKINKLTTKLSAVMVNRLSDGINNVLRNKFKALDDMGSIWIDPLLKDCPLPTQQRSASESLMTVGRGTKLPIGDNNTLRMFIYWKGIDVDLSATLYNDQFEKIEQISYTRIKSDNYEACHSGDITWAPNGASEFIDITIDTAVSYGARYIIMSVLVFDGPMFAEHEECFAGWMTRDKPNSNEIYDPKTVSQKVDLRSNSQNAIPVIFDLVERKAIWADIATSKRTKFGGNNVESNRASLEETMQAIVTMKNKMSLYDLFLLHGSVRGTLVNNKEDAEKVFSMYEGTTPYNISEINSEYIA